MGSLLIVSLVFMKRLFLAKPYGLVKLAAVVVVFVFFVAVSCLNFVRCCRDYRYVTNDTYVEEKAKVVEFTYSKRDYDGNGQIINAKPKFLIVDKGEYIILNAKNVDVGKTYIIRYYPNTRICEIVQEIQ